jgi:hypothetical protein
LSDFWIGVPAPAKSDQTRTAAATALRSFTHEIEHFEVRHLHQQVHQRRVLDVIVRQVQHAARHGTARQGCWRDCIAARDISPDGRSLQEPLEIADILELVALRA